MKDVMQDRPVVHSMTDREIAEETLILMRAFADMLMQIGNNPMVAAMMPGFNPRG